MKFSFQDNDKIYSFCSKSDNINFPLGEYFKGDFILIYYLMIFSLLYTMFNFNY